MSRGMLRLGQLRKARARFKDSHALFVLPRLPALLLPYSARSGSRLASAPGRFYSIDTQASEAARTSVVGSIN